MLECGLGCSRFPEALLPLLDISAASSHVCGERGFGRQSVPGVGLGKQIGGHMRFLCHLPVGRIPRLFSQLPQRQREGSDRSAVVDEFFLASAWPHSVRHMSPSKQMFHRAIKQILIVIITLVILITLVIIAGHACEQNSAHSNLV